MEAWLKQISQTLEAVAEQSERWLLAASKDASEAMDELLDASVSALSEFEDAVLPTFERLSEDLAQILEPGIDFLEENLDRWVEDTAAPLTHTLQPWLQEHPTCIGCRHYHGENYGENILICAMYPYGPDQETCPDWESVWDQSDRQ
ncbi:hypothetical protein IQ241_15715 [Romeria aff. gracilis LEGE 07310]|uniref:Uncharacterized protein n=1 Tax=Vasconcelosia minhoensis LEGE 07310 TaxID=915328 RepID=A0A8J7DNW7_9CYAN|nr:hypothetical protein [Romeria gracilis]MBE9078725.1 hypothetical protein [Romeria aff. gracilis LEGE 07310]